MRYSETVTKSLDSKIRLNSCTWNKWSKRPSACTQPHRCFSDDSKTTWKYVSKRHYGHVWHISMYREYTTCVLITSDEQCLFSATGDLVLPKGSTCIMAPLLTHHLSDLYPSPGVFDPERFSAENVAKRHKYSFLPFSDGPRGCIGELVVSVTAVERKW